MLIDHGAVVERDGAWVAANELAEVEVPETIEALVRARLDSLPRDERSILQGQRSSVAPSSARRWRPSWRRRSTRFSSRPCSATS